MKSQQALIKWFKLRMALLDFIKSMFSQEIIASMYKHQLVYIMILLTKIKQVVMYPSETIKPRKLNWLNIFTEAINWYKLM